MSADLPPNRISELLAERGERMEVLAVELDVSTPTVWRYVNGKSGIPDRHKLTLADHFDVDVSHLMGWDRADDDRVAA